MPGQYTTKSDNETLVLDFPAPPTRHYFWVMTIVFWALMLPLFLDPRVDWMFKVGGIAFLSVSILALRWVYQPREAQTVTVNENSIRITTGEDQQDIPAYYVDRIFVRETKGTWASERKAQAFARLKDLDVRYGVVLHAAAEETVFAAHLPLTEQHRICRLIVDTLADSEDLVAT